MEMRAEPIAVRGLCMGGRAYHGEGTMEMKNAQPITARGLWR